MLKTQIELNLTKIRLIEAQMMILNYQMQELLKEKEGLIIKDSQAAFDASVDTHDNPSGATVQRDNFSGS